MILILDKSINLIKNERFFLNVLNQFVFERLMIVDVFVSKSQYFDTRILKEKKKIFAVYDTSTYFGI